MDEMILQATASVEEKRTQLDRVPWLERGERGFFKAWFATIGMALVNPGRLMRALPDTRAVGAAWWFAILTNTPNLLLGSSLFLVIPVMIALWGGYGVARTNLLLAVGGPLAISLVVAVGVTLAIVAIWGLVTHGLLRMTGPTSQPLGRTYEAICYSTGANVGTAVPCLGFYVGWIWWLVSAVVMVKVAQKVQGWRAALAVLMLPGVSILIAAGLFAWMFYSLVSGTGPMAMRFAQRNANIVVSGMLGYAQDHAGKGPSHALELVHGGYIVTIDLIGTKMTTKRRLVPVVNKTLEEFSKLPQTERDAAVEAAIAALPDNVVAHRLGDVVFVHHGIDFNACDVQLWIIVQSPDPNGGATRLPSGKVLIGHCDGTVTAVDDADFPRLLIDQNEVRRKLGLAPLPDPRKLPQTP